MLREAAERYRVFPVGETVSLAQSPFDPNNAKVQILGYERHWTEYGPEPFVNFYQVEYVGTGNKKLLHPKVLHHTVKWDFRTPYADAFSAVTKALRKAGFLDDLHREAGTRRGQLGFAPKYGKKVSVSKVIQALSRDLDASPVREVQLNKFEMQFQVPTGDTTKETFKVQVSADFDDTDLLRRIDVI
jgi:hypothetical protein